MNIDQTISEYYFLLSKWNKVISLISTAKTEEEFRAKHVDDVFAVLPFLDNANTLLDIGTGAGIPGIIIKIARPEIDVTLLDSTRKKINFCEEVIRQLKLNKIKAVCGRAENPEIKNTLGKFDVVISRATWKLKELIENSIDYFGSDSKLIAMKSEKWEKEFDDAQKTMEKHGVRLQLTYEYTLTAGEKRTLLILRTTGHGAS